MNKKLLLLILFVVSFDLFGSAFFTAKPKKVSQQKDFFAGGILQFESQTQIVAQFNGYISGVFVRAGDRVRKNQTLLKIKREEPGFINQDFPIKAPFNGIVRSVNAYQGSRVSAQTSLMVVADENSLRFYADLFLQDLQYIKSGMSVQLIFPNIVHELKGKVEKILEGNPAKKTAQVIVKIDQPQNLLIPFSEGKMRFSVQSGSVWLVPAEALLRDRSGYFVWIKENGIARKRSVKIGELQGTDFQILEGIEGSEEIIVFGTDDLKENQRVDEF